MRPLRSPRGADQPKAPMWATGVVVRVDGLDGPATRSDAPRHQVETHPNLPRAMTAAPGERPPAPPHVTTSVTGSRLLGLAPFPLVLFLSACGHASNVASPDPPPSPTDCQPWETRCGDRCVSLHQDADHCGACGHSCSGEPCKGGHCGPCYADEDCRPFYPQGVCLMPWTVLCGHPSCAADRPPPCTETSCGQGKRCQAGHCLAVCTSDADCDERQARCVELTAGKPKVCTPPGSCVPNTTVP